MGKVIFFLAKVFDNENYAEDFISGKVFANRLSYFKELEEEDSANRSDRHEGTVSWYQPDQIKNKWGQCQHYTNRTVGNLADKMGGGSTNTFTIITDKFGDLQSAFPEGL